MNSPFFFLFLPAGVYPTRALACRESPTRDEEGEGGLTLATLDYSRSSSSKDPGKGELRKLTVFERDGCGRRSAAVATAAPAGFGRRRREEIHGGPEFALNPLFVMMMNIVAAPLRRGWRSDWRRRAEDEAFGAEGIRTRDRLVVFLFEGRAHGGCHHAGRGRGPPGWAAGIARALLRGRRRGGRGVEEAQIEVGCGVEAHLRGHLMVPASGFRDPGSGGAQSPDGLIDLEDIHPFG